MTNDKDELSQLASLCELIANFEQLDASISDSLKDGNFEIIDQTLVAKKEVKRLLSESKPLTVDRSLGLKIKKIRDNYGYTIDRVIDRLSEITGTNFSQESEEDIDFVDALFSEGTADYVDEGFFTRRNQVATLIVSESLPSHFVHHFLNLRECYALGLFEATVIYCRAVIETGCFEALRRRGKVNVRFKVEDIREFSLKMLLRSIKPFVYSGNWDNADKVIKKADSILHSKREKVVVTQEEAHDAFKDTFAIIEELFSGTRR